MSTSFNRLVFRAKAVLCLVLLMTATFHLSGCATAPGGLLPADQLRIPLTNNDALSEALAGSPFAGASALDIFPVRQEFSLVMPDDSKVLSGKYAFSDGQFTITEVFAQNAGRSGTLTMDVTKQVNRIATSDGLEWKLDNSAARTAPQSAAGLDAYLQANAALLLAAKEMDAQAGTNAPSASTVTANPISTSPKPSAALNPLFGVLYTIAIIWYPIIGFFDTLLTVFTVSTILQSSLVGRFDGTWNASNAGNQLRVTISGGKITRIIDSASGQQLNILDNQSAIVEGNNVTFTADANVLGQSTPVTFEFDVQEMSNGSLVGSLTTLGNTFARVPVTLTRA